MEPGETRSLRIVSRPEEVRRAARFCHRACAGLFSGSECHDIELAIAEACNNIVEHAYGYCDDQPIWIRVSRQPEEILFRIEDEAATPFTPGEVTPPAVEWHSLADVPEGGWGIYLMREAMDSVRYRRRGRRNRLELSKRLLPVEPAMQGADGADAAPEPELVQQLRGQLEASEEAVTELARELATVYESLNTFYTVSRQVSALSSEEELLETVLRQALTSAEAHWGSLRLRQGDKLVRRAVAGTPPDCPEVLPLDGDGVEETVARLGGERIVCSPGAVPVMCLPITGLDGFLGTLLIGGSERPEGYLSAEVKLARALANQVGVSLENHRLYGNMIQAQLDRRELEIAHSLQQRLCPTRVPEIPGLRLFAHVEAAREVGGDYVAVLPRRDNVVDFVVADAMGKGMSAAFFSILTHMAFHSIRFLGQDASPGSMLTAFNRIMAPDLERFDMFLTVLLGRVDVADGALYYASAGHCPPLLIDNAGDARFLRTQDFMVGVAPDTSYVDLSAGFAPGDKLLCYTDGLVDVVDPTAEVAGVEQLRRACEGTQQQPVDAICRRLMTEAVAGAPENGILDDIALIGIERVGNGVPVGRA